jgi:hypothetical protein
VKKIDNILLTFFIVIFFFQTILIGHRLNFKPYLLLNFFKKNAGIKESMEININFSKSEEIFQFLKKYNLKDFNISNELRKDISYQRTVELNYPIKINEKSKNFFSINKDQLKNCKLKDYSTKIYFYECK